jgi:hypothetical protein
MFFTTGELPMSNAQRVALTDFIQAGGGFLGVHSATDTFYQWPEYRKIIGGYFDQHPWHQAVVVEVADRDDPLVAFLGETIAVTDEIYQIRETSSYPQGGWGLLVMYMVVNWEMVNSIYQSYKGVILPNLRNTTFTTMYSDVL